MEFQYLLVKVKELITSKEQILNQYGLYDHEPPKSYKAKKYCSNHGITFWLSTTRNKATRELILSRLSNAN